MSQQSGPGDAPDNDLSAKTPFLSALQDLLSASSGPINWELARQLAVQGAAAADPAVSAGSRSAVADSVRLAEVWLDGVTDLPSGGAADGLAWTRLEWVEATLPVWRSVCDPVAAQVVTAMQSGLGAGLAALASGEVTGAELGLPPGVDLAALTGGGGAGVPGQVGEVLRALGGLLFGAQVGQALGALSAEVLSAFDVGLPLIGPGQVALVPANVEAFGAGLEVPAADVLIYLSLREAASARLFGHVPWLRHHLLGLVEDYARGIDVDPAAAGRAMSAASGIDPSDPEALQRAIGQGLFTSEPTPAQQVALSRLETVLALVEGWVDVVVDAAAGPRLPTAPALRESLRRRRATGGPAEQTFAALVGLQLRPRRLREAAALWQRAADAGGQELRDRIWAHPDLLPGAEDLDDPTGFLDRLQSTF